MDSLYIKLGLLVAGLIVGYSCFRGREAAQNVLSSLVFRWLLPYIVFMEISAMALQGHWYLYSLAGAAFVLVPFFLGQWLFGLNTSRAVIVATAEGGSLGFAIYATIGTAALTQFFLVDMVGNGLAVFLIVFPYLMQGKRDWGMILNRLTITMLVALVASAFSFRPLLAGPEFLRQLEPLLVMGLVFAVATVVGAGIKFQTSRGILTSRFFVGFWVYRLAGLGASLLFGWPLALTILFILPPSFLLPVFYRAQKMPEDVVLFTDNFIVSCLPITIMLAAYLIAF